MIPQITEINFPAYATLNNATVTLAEMGDRTITTQIKIDGDIVPDFTGWALEFKGERFVLPTKEPQAAKDNTSRRSTVDLTFTSWAVNELKRYFFVEMASITAGTAIADKYKASLGLNLENFVIAFNNVLDYYFAGQIRMDLFGAGTGMYSQEPSFVEIDNTYIWEVLQKVYEIYDVRWTFAYDDTNHRYLIKVGYPAPEIDDHDFEYGYQGGLLRFERQVQDYDITNVLLGRGGEKNLPYRYFKKVDPNNPEWQADPDAIPELKNIYFENLRDINFRRYVQGWKTNPRRMLEEGDVIEDYDTERAETDWAYAKGHTDAKFNPVEYVKDDDSIALYGEHWGALENNENIFPSIQGIEVPPYGRIDEVVDVEPVTTDDIEAMATDAAVITNVQGATRTEWIPYNNRLTIELTGADFTVPENKTGNLTMVGTWVKSVQYGKKNGHQDNIEPDSAIANLVNIDTTNSYIVAVRKDNSQEYPISGLAAGSYYYKMHIEVRSEFEREQYDEVSVTVGVDSLKLTVSEGTANAWKPTFDIWVKNIWDTTQGENETDAAYAARVWEPILGDRTGAEAAVVFSTGFLSISADYNFVIASIPVVDRTKTIDGVASEWRITLIKSDAEYDATGKYIPNSETGGNASAGDFFYFTGIDMPWIYVKWAEERLNAYKETELAKVKQINPTWVVQIDKVRANTKEQGELEYLADRFASGAKLRVRDKRFTNNNILTLYVQTITYTWQQPSSGNPYLVPDIEVVLSDKIVSVESPIDRLEGSVDLIQTSYAKISDIEGAIRRVASPIFLKKTGESEMSLSPTRFSSIVSSESFRQGDIGGQGWGAYVDGEGHTVLEADTVVVRKDMRVNTLTVNQIAYLGGKQIISAAAMECNRVEEVDGGYKCYFDQKQGSVANLFKVDDVVLGQVWNADESELRYYKRKVIAIDSDSITLSSSIADGTGVPHPKDIMVQYGSYSDTSRQYVILRDVIGGGYERMLSGLTSVYTDGTEYYFAGRQDGSTPRWFVGDALGQYASYQNGVLNIAGRLAVTTQIDTGNGTYTALSNYLSSLQDQIDSTVQTWYAAGVPTLNNYPANTWATVEDKNNHIGDLYYDSDTGKAYRFMLDGNTYKWVQLADEDIAAALALAQQNQTAIAGLQYLKAATNQGTLVQGGLVLTSMIQLGQTEQGVYKVYSGINGIMDSTALGNGIAAWYGGQMADKEADNTLTNYAKSLFRFDGSGYLASGNIKWDLNGNGQIPGITWENGRITLSSDIYLQGGDRLTALIDAVNRMYSQFAYDSQDHITVAPTHALYIPTTSPEYPIAGKVALYYDYNGFYSETPGGGVANIFDLTIRRGSVSAGTYNLGEQAADINLASLFAGYATETWVSANFNKYVLPIASASTLGGIKVGNGLSIDSSTGVLTATYSYTLPTASSSVKGGVKVGNTLTISNEVLNVVAGSVAQSNTGFVTGGDVYSAIAAAVTSALHYRGMSSTALTDGGTETAVIGGVSLVPQSGDVVIYGGFEFLWENSVWNKLGDDSSYALKTVQISAGTGLTGGGDLTSSRTISLSSATIASLGLADSALQSSDMKALTLKVGTSTVGSDYNAIAAKTYTISKTNITDTIGSTTYAPYHADGYLPLSAGSSKPLTDDLYFTKTIYGADVQVGRIGSVIDGGIVTYFTNPSSGSGSGTGPGFAIINTPYEKLLFWLGSTDDSLEIYHEGNLTKGVLTTLLESNNGYYVKKSGDTMTGTLNSQSIIPTSNTSYDLGSSASKWNNIYTRSLYASVAKISDLLSIPTVAPASGSIVSGEAYLYSSTGSYAETPGGGVADVYPLTITKNGSAWLYYNPGTQAESINLVVPTALSDLTADSTHRLVTDTEKATWNAKYDKPSGGIPGTDLATAYLPLTGGTMSGNINLPSGVYIKETSTYTYAILGYSNSGFSIGAPNYKTTIRSNNNDLIHTKGSTNYTIYDSSNLTISTLGGVPSTRTVNGKALSSDITLSLDEVADGSTRKLANYLPLAGNAVASKITGNVILGNNVFLQGVHTNGTDVRELIGLDNNNIVTVGCSTNQLRLITSSVDIKHNKNGTLYSVYDESNLSLATLAGSSAIGSTSKPVYYNGSSLVACGTSLTDYLPLAGGVVTGNVFLKGSANLVTNSTGNYANGIRINRASTSTWAGMTIGYVSSDQAGGGTGYDSHTWMIATPGTSDYLNISYNGNTSTTIGLTLKGNGVNDLLWNNNKVWHEGNLTKSVLTTLLDSNSGYYLPLTAGSSYPLTGDLYLNASSAAKSIYMTDASSNAHQVATLTTAGNLTIGNNQPTYSGMTVIRGATISLAVGDSTTNEKYNVNFFGSNGSFYPSPDNAVTWGDSSKKFKAIYAYKYYGLLDDFTYLVNHAGNIDDVGVTNSKGVNFYYASSGTKPTGSQDGSTITLAYSNAWVTQMYGDWRTNKFYTRVRTNGTWGDWAELATTKGTVEGLNTSTESDATFTYRAVPSVAVGDVARATKVKGKTIVWNQLVPTNWFATNTPAHVSWTNNGDGSYTINGTASGVGQVIAFTPRKSFGDHKYYLATSDSTIAIYFNGTNANQGTYTDSRQIVTAQASDTYYPCIRFQSGATFSSKKVYIKIIDLTLMFGKGSEPTSVAEFEALYPLPFYSYNTGELVSNSANAIETVGFNLWDEDTMFLGVSGVTRTSDGWVATSANIAGHGHYWENTIGYTGQMCIYMKALANSSSGNFRFTFAYTDGTSSSGPVLSGTSIDEYVLSTSGKVVSNIRADYGSNRTITLQKLCLSFYDASRNGQYEPYRKDNLPLNITKLKVDTTNLWDEQWEQGTLDTNGADYASTINIRNKGYIPVEGGKTYYVKGNIQVYEYDSAKNYITRTFLNSGTITLNVNTCYLRWRSADNYTYTEGDIWINLTTKRPPLKLNQMFENGDFSNGTTGWGYYNSSISAQNGALSVQVTQVNGGFTTTSDKNPTLIGGHKYFIQYAFNSPSATSTFVYFNGNSFIAGKNVKAGYNVYAGIGTISTTATGPVIARFNATGTYTVYSIVLIDLTKMYGAGLEPTDTEIVSERIGLYRPYTTGEYMPYYAFPKGMRCADYACSVCDEVIGKRAIVRVGAVDLGLMSWTRDSSGIFYTGSVPGSVSRTSGTTHMILPKYNQKNAFSSIGGASSNGDYCQAGARIAIYDTGYSDAVSFQRSLNSVKLYFELSTPIFYDLETAVPELIECDVLGTQRRLPEDTASSVQAPFHCDFQYGANPGEIVSDSAYRYLPLAGGTVTGTLECKGELVVPDHAPYEPEPNKHYLYVNDNGNYYQS